MHICVYNDRYKLSFISCKCIGYRFWMNVKKSIWKDDGHSQSVSQSVQEKITVKQVALYLVITFLVSWSLDELAKDIS